MTRISRTVFRRTSDSARCRASPETPLPKPGVDIFLRQLPRMSPFSPFTSAHSAEAERTTIGALLRDPDRIVEVAGTLKAEDFFDPSYRLIYQAMQHLYEAREPIDFVTVTAELQKNQKIQEIGGSAFLAELATSVPTPSHAEHYAAII